MTTPRVAGTRLASGGRLHSSSVLLSLVLFTGCAFIRNIPATSTPVREARYYRTQDAANFAGGAVAGQALSLVIRGPYKCGEWGHYCGSFAPFARIGLVGALGLVRRQTDNGYRESSAFMNMAGAMASEWVRLVIFGILKNRDRR